MKTTIIIVTMLYAMGVTAIAILLFDEVEKLMGVGKYQTREEWKKVDHIHD